MATPETAFVGPEANLLLDGSHHRTNSRRRRSSDGFEGRSLIKYTRVHNDPIESTRYRRRRSSTAALCSQCASIDLVDILWRYGKTSDFHGELVKEFEIHDRPSLPTCSLCKFLAQMRVPSYKDGHKPLSDTWSRKKYRLQAFAGAVSYQEYFLKPFTRAMSCQDPTLLAVIPDPFPVTKSNKLYANTIGQIGYISPVAHTSDAPWLTARVVHSHRINFPLLQNWLQFCKKHHDCGRRFSRPDKLKVIDCNTMKIILAPRNCNYLALSYVWGAAQDSTHDHDTAQNEVHELSHVVPVVRDAIQVVKRLGKRYLWVDKYCIDQHEKGDKEYQIRMMDLTYEGSFATIVAAAGFDDRYGLPGVSLDRHRQPSIDLGDAQFASTLPDPQLEIRKSKWMTRAWTYQEALCSERLIIFTDHQVYFECKVMHCCEAVEIPLNILHTPNRKALNEWVRPTMFKDEWVQGTYKYGPIPTFWNCVKNYTSRQMTYDYDALNAMEGILRRFQAKPSFIYNILGIPIQTKDGDINDRLEPSNFIAGLSWHHSEPSRRRACLPSWTWGGWEGPLALHRNFGSWGFHTTMSLSVLRQDGEIKAWDDFWVEYWTSEGKEVCSSQLNCLHISAEVFKVQLSFMNPQTRDGRQHYLKPDVYLMNPYTGARYCRIVLPKRFLQDEHQRNKIKGELWDCVLLGWKAKCSGPDVMLINWTLDCAERMWAGTLFFKVHGMESHRKLLPPTLHKKFKLI